MNAALQLQGTLSSAFVRESHLLENERHWGPCGCLDPFPKWQATRSRAQLTSLIHAAFCTASFSQSGRSAPPERDALSVSPVVAYGTHLVAHHNHVVALRSRIGSGADAQAAAALLSGFAARGERSPQISPLHCCVLPAELGAQVNCSLAQQ